MKLALKLPQLNRSWLMLAGALMLGGAALVLSQKLLSNHMKEIDEAERNAHKMVEVVVASRDIARNEPVTVDRFQKRLVPVDYVSTSAVRPDHFMQYIGSRLADPLKRGDILIGSQMESASNVFSSTLENGNRGLTTEVDEVNSISGMLRPTDRIDLMVTARGSGATAKETTFTLLSNVEVLATGQATRKREGSTQARTYTTITLSVSPEDAQRIIVAKNSGKLTAVLRNPDDAKANATAAMSIDDVMPKHDHAGVKRLPVQYIVGGRG
jgi:pilus assembly protein CpaB